MGDRSKVIWAIENDLLESGVPFDDVFMLIKCSVWNKFKGRNNEDEIITNELRKVEAKVIVKENAREYEQEEEELESKSFVVESYEGLMSSLDTYPGWLVEGFWLNNSHGIVAGEPKTFKSTLALDFAVSVASGRNFLGKYAVNSPGPVIYIQNENAKWIMKDRIEKITYNKGLGGRIRLKGRDMYFRPPSTIPLHFINTQAYLLNDPEHRELTQEIIRQYKPKLIIFDPLYLMFDGDINSAQELNPILAWLLQLKVEFKCAIMLIHHWNKGSKNNAGSRGGQRMLGSTTLHGWIESAWYIKTHGEQEEDTGEDTNKVQAQSDIVIEREFRGAGVHPKVELSLSMGDIGSSKYSIETKVHHGSGSGNKTDLATTEVLVLNFLLVQKDCVSMRHMAAELGLSRVNIKASIDRLVESGAVEEVSRGLYTTS